jgi:uncharacterized protein (DUF1800 family)
MKGGVGEMGEWNYEQAAHLLRRAGFGGTPEDIEFFLVLGREGAVDYLVNYEQVDDSAMEQALDRARFLETEPGRQLSVGQIQQWWLFRMIHTKRPLLEKMTLFWHDHFATAVSKVVNRQLMLRQNELFRRLALGNFREMLVEVAQDPAMILWLDNNTNVKGSPNENFARELMELFTTGITDVITGEENYTERDIQEAARAFTGWTIRRGRFFFNAGQHDFGEKTVLGHTGELGGEDVVDILVERRATARFLAKKLLEFFVHPDPEPELIEEIADVYLDSNYDVRTVVREVLLSEAFSSERALLANVKSPVEFVVGMIRELKVDVQMRFLVGPLALMEQVLFNPPTVAGWDWGLGWINTATLLTRYNVASALASVRQARGAEFDPARLLPEGEVPSAEAVVDHFLRILGPLPVSSETRQALIDYLNGEGPFELNARTIDKQVRGLIHLILTLPEYQLN